MKHDELNLNILRGLLKMAGDVVDYDSTGIEAMRARVPRVNLGEVVKRNFGLSADDLSFCSYLGINDFVDPKCSHGCAVFRPVEGYKDPVAQDPVAHLGRVLNSNVGSGHREVTSVFVEVGPGHSLAGYSWRAAA